MDLETFRWLLTADGQALLEEAGRLDLSDAGRLAALERLRRIAGPARAAAAYEVAAARRRAAAKFPLAERLYFTREALEQSSGAVVAGYRAGRYAQLGGQGAAGHVADLGCGAGGDTLAFAAAGMRVTAVDRDPLRLAMAEANAAAAGLAGRASFRLADVERERPPAADALFFDPSRRSGGRRVFSLADYSPPVSLVRSWREATPAIGVKVAPGVADEELAPLGVDELEFISLDGELKEAVLWFGPLAPARGRRATLLATAERSSGGAAPSEAAGDDGRPRSSLLPAFSRATLFLPTSAQPPQLDISEPEAYLYEPDPAVIRAHLVAQLGLQLGAAQLDPEIAYLTAARVVATPFARCWRVLEWMPFGMKRLRARLRALDAGPVTVKKRGSPLDADALARSLAGGGARPLVVVLTQVAGRPAALICEGPIAGAEERAE